MNQMVHKYLVRISIFHYQRSSDPFVCL